MKTTLTVGEAPEHDGFLESEDDLDVVKLPSDVLIRTFKKGLWDRINVECDTNIDAYEGVWLEPSNLVKAANVIRQSLNGDRGAPVNYVECLVGAARMLESCSSRHVKVMFSL